MANFGMAVTIAAVMAVSAVSGAGVMAAVMQTTTTVTCTAPVDQQTSTTTPAFQYTPTTGAKGF